LHRRRIPQRASLSGKMEEFLANILNRQKQFRYPQSSDVSGFENSTFNSLNTFRFIDGGGALIWAVGR